MVFSSVTQFLSAFVLRLLEIGIDQVIHRMELVECSPPPCSLAPARSPIARRLFGRSNRPSPRRVKMCDGMYPTRATIGRDLAQARAACRPSSAVDG